VLGLLPPEARGESMVGAALLVGLLAVLTWRSGTSYLRGQIPLLAAVMFSALLSWWALVPAAAPGPLALGVLAAAAGLGAAWLGEDERLTHAAVVVLALVGCVVALYALYQWGWGLERLSAIVLSEPAIPDREALLTRLGRGRAFAWFITPAALGGYLALSVSATVGLALSSRGVRRWVWCAAALIGGGAFLAAASATAAAALLGAVILASLVATRARRGLVVGALALVVLLAGVTWMRGDRLLNLQEQESPWQLRAGNFRVAATMAADHPWTGVGPGGFAERYPLYRRAADNETRHAHNLALELVAEWGWPVGTGLAVLFFVIFLQPLWRERGGPAWRRGLAVGLAAFALQNLADFTAFMPSLLWSAALLRGRLSGSRPGVAAGAGGGAERVIAAASLVAVLLAGGLAGLSGLAANARLSARAAAFAGEAASALKPARHAVHLAPWDVEAALLLARIELDLWQQAPDDEQARREASAAVERAVRLAPTRASARELRARLRLAAGDAPGALADLSAAAELNPTHEAYRARRDRLHERLVARGQGRAR